MGTEDVERGKLLAKVERLEQDLPKLAKDVDDSKQAIATIRIIISTISIIGAAVWANPRQIVTILRGLFP